MTHIAKCLLADVAVILTPCGPHVRPASKDVRRRSL
jgi:hypothetical protein